MDGFDRFEEKELPPKMNSILKLTDENINDSDYELAKTVWKTFIYKTMGDYRGLYLKTEVLILADFFENFRKTSMQYNDLDPSHYFSSPVFAWDAMLKC